jgi:hypothetical protein
MALLSKELNQLVKGLMALLLGLNQLVQWLMGLLMGLLMELLLKALM